MIQTKSEIHFLEEADPFYYKILQMKTPSEHHHFDNLFRFVMLMIGEK